MCENSTSVEPFQIKLLKYFSALYSVFIWKLQSLAENKGVIPTNKS